MAMTLEDKRARSTREKVDTRKPSENTYPIGLLRIS